MKEKSIQWNLVINGIKTLMSLLFPLITFPYASRILGASGIGKVGYASSIISYFSLIASLGISTYAVREGARLRDAKDRYQTFIKEIFTINLCTTLIAYACFILFLCLPVLTEYKILLLIFSFGILFTTIGMEWLFVMEEEYAYITKRAILFQCVSLVVLFVFVRDQNDYPWYAALTVIASGGSAIMNLWHSRKFVDWRAPHHGEYRKHIRPILLIFGTTLASSLYLTMDTTMLGIFRGDTQVGIYDAASKINLVISTLMGTISATILPRVSYYVGTGRDQEYQHLMHRSMELLMMIAMPAALGMITTADSLILLFSGKEFLAGTLAARILSVKVVVGAVNRILAYQVCIPYKKDQEVLISTTMGAICNFLANIMLIPRFGVTGAAIATLLSEMVVFGVLTGYAQAVLEQKGLYRRCGIYLFACIFFYPIRLLVGQLVTGAVLQLFLTVVLSACSYFAFLFYQKDPYMWKYWNLVVARIRSR
jgi:O-antigen/teichoic acid export membrane protein